MNGPSRPVRWLSPSRDEIRGVPEDVQDGIGFRLRQVQQGVKTGDGIKPFAEDNRISHLVKISVDGADRNTYRTAVTVEFEEGVWVLDVFEKRSSSGISTPKKDIDRIHERLKRLQAFRRTPEGRAVIQDMKLEWENELRRASVREARRNPRL